MKSIIKEFRKKFIPDTLLFEKIKHNNQNYILVLAPLKKNSKKSYHIIIFDENNNYQTYGIKNKNIIKPTYYRCLKINLYGYVINACLHNIDCHDILNIINGKLNNYIKNNKPIISYYGLPLGYLNEESNHKLIKPYIKNYYLVRFNSFCQIYKKYKGNKIILNYLTIDLSLTNKYFIKKFLVTTNITFKDIIRVLNKVISKEGNLFIDYYRMREQLLNEGYKIKCPLIPEDTVKWHDYILKIYLNQEKVIDPSLQESYIDNYYNQAKIFEYKNEKYSIIACKKLSELIREGKVLNHCVGSYVKSVSEGNEYILFLRNNEFLDDPYFTLDLTPNKILRQAHGKNNCNVSKDLMPFIQSWAKYFNIDITNISSVLCHL